MRKRRAKPRRALRDQYRLLWLRAYRRQLLRLDASHWQVQARLRMEVRGARSRLLLLLLRHRRVDVRALLCVHYHYRDSCVMRERGFACANCSMLPASQVSPLARIAAAGAGAAAAKGSSLLVTTAEAACPAAKSSDSFAGSSSHNPQVELTSLHGQQQLSVDLAASRARCHQLELELHTAQKQKLLLEKGNEVLVAELRRLKETVEELEEAGEMVARCWDERCQALEGDIARLKAGLEGERLARSICEDGAAGWEDEEAQRDEGAQVWRTESTKYEEKQLLLLQLDDRAFLATTETGIETTTVSLPAAPSTFELVSVFLSRAG